MDLRLVRYVRKQIALVDWINLSTLPSAMPTNEISLGDLHVCGNVGIWQRTGAKSDDVTIKIISSGFKCTLKLSLSSKVSDLTADIAERMDCAEEEVTIICKGRIISMSSDCNLRLKACGLTDGCKLFVSKRPAGPRWLGLTVHFVLTDLPPMKLRMHATSPTINVKRQLRELLRAPMARMSLHLVDGTTLVDSMTLRDLSIRNDSIIYCILEQEGWRELRDGVPNRFSRLAARVQSLVEGSRLEVSGIDHAQDDGCEKEEMIQEHLRRHELAAQPCASAQEDNQTPQKRSRVSADRPDCQANQPCISQGDTFLGMRRGFLCARRRTSLRRAEEPAALSDHDSHSTDSGEESGSANGDADACDSLPELPPAEMQASAAAGRVAAAAERARLAGIPSVIRTGRASLAMWISRPASPASLPPVPREPDVAPSQTPKASSLPACQPPAEKVPDAGRGCEFAAAAHGEPCGPQAPAPPVLSSGDGRRAAAGSGCACCGRRLALGAVIR
jgi:hypothetical protein